MGSYENFYHGTDYDFGAVDDLFQGMTYKTPVSQMAIATDPRTANQLQSVSERFNTGLKTVEVSMLTPNVAEAIPEQHLEEINRLKKLVGADLTLHGPLVDPTGITKQGWDPTQREQAERQMWQAVERGHKLDPEGNIVVTFHSSHGLPDPETRVIDENKKPGEKGREVVTEMMVVNERDGQFTHIMPKHNYLLDEKPDPAKELKEQNKRAWETTLTQVSFHALNGKEAIEKGLEIERSPKRIEEERDKRFKNAMKKIWELSKSSEGRDKIDKVIGDNNLEKKEVERRIETLNHGEIYVKEAYLNLQDHFNKAWAATEKAVERAKNEEDRKKAEEDRKKLKKYSDELIKKRDKLFSKDFKAENAELLGIEVQKGVNILNSLSETPALYRPLKDFAVEQASETFANIALKSYEKFQDNSPIISVENPPVGMGLNRAEDLRDLIKETRSKFVKEAQEKFDMSKEEAEERAKKLIGVTWDLGHINMIRKYGYGEEDLVKQTKEIAPFVNKIHLSDNFGMEHTELPMGMGNVPTKKHMEILDKYNEKVKKIIEAGDWYQHFKTMPVQESLAAFGSPIYAMQMAPYWNKAAFTSGGYFSGYGMNPEVHHSMYGAGFANLPVELGGQMAGKSRLSGAPME
jgi:sugar phosphate isomerase/epimerase